MEKVDKAAILALVQMAIGLGSLIAGVVFIGLGTNLYIAIGVFLLIMYYNSTKD